MVARGKIDTEAKPQRNLEMQDENNSKYFSKQLQVWEQ